MSQFWREKMFRVATSRYGGLCVRRPFSSFPSSWPSLAGMGGFRKGRREDATKSATARNRLAPASASAVSAAAATGADAALFSKLRAQFEAKLQHKGVSESAWNDYEKLLDSMLDRVNGSIISHHFLFRSISTTPTPLAEDLDSKTRLLNKLVSIMGKSTRTEEHIQLAQLFEFQNDKRKLSQLVNILQADGIVIPIQIYNSLIKVYLNHGDASDAVTLFNTIRADWKRSKDCVFFKDPSSRPSNKTGICPSSHTYYLMLHHYFEVDAFRTIDNLVAEMESWNVQLTTSTYDVWMTSLLRQDRYGDVVAAFEGMKARGLKANFSIFNVVITALCNNGGSTEQLLDTWSQFKTEGTVGSWRLTLIGNRVLGKLSRELEHLETSFTLFNEIRDVARHVANIRGGNPPPTELFARTYSLAVSMCCRFSMKDRELLDRALILLNDMKQDGLSPSSRIYQGILFALSNACLSYPTSSATKYVKALMLLYHEMLENHPAAFGPLRLQHAVIRAFLKSGEYSEANLAVKKGLEGMNPLAFANELKALATTTLLSSGSSSLSVNRKCMADNVAHLLDKLVNGVKQNTLESNMQSWKLLNLPSHPRFALDDTCVMLFNSKLGLAEDASMRAFNNYALFVQYWEVAKDGGPHYSCHHSRVIDALLCQLPSMSIVPFLLNLESRGWKPSVSGLIELCKQLPSLDERQKLVSAVQGLGWKHKRTYLLLETIINSLYGLNDGYVPALKDAVWQEAGVEEAEVNTLLEFSIENGCSVSFAS